MNEERYIGIGFGVLLVGLIVAIILAIVEDIGTHDERNRRTDLHFEYAVFDGHEYVVYLGSHRFGLAHSPRCDCLRAMEYVQNEMEKSK